MLAVAAALGAETSCADFFVGDAEGERDLVFLLVTIRDVSGESSVASVAFESASRSTAAARGFLRDGVTGTASPGAAGSPISFALLGVGVGAGGGVLVLCSGPLSDALDALVVLDVLDVLDALAILAVLAVLAVFAGFVGASVAVSSDASSVLVFLLRPFCAGTGGGGATVVNEADDEASSSAAATSRADLRVDMFATGWDFEFLLTVR